jgi:hypothetical protein
LIIHSDEFCPKTNTDGQVMGGHKTVISELKEQAGLREEGEMSFITICSKLETPPPFSHLPSQHLFIVDREEGSNVKHDD